MKSILLTAMLAVAGFASKVPLVSVTNSDTPWDLKLPTDMGTATLEYDVNFGYGLEGSIDQGDTEGVMDAWVQGSLWSNADLILRVNLYNTQLFNLKLSIVPFHIIPMWASFYYTHPAAVYQGIVDEFAAALDFGYELHTGEAQVSYYTNSLVPKVSLADAVLSSSGIYYPEVPGSTFASNANGVNGWDWNVDPNEAWVDEPYFAFDLLQWAIDEGKVEADGYASYLFIPLVGESISAAQ